MSEAHDPEILFNLFPFSTSFTSTSVDMSMNTLAFARVALWSSLVARAVMEALVLLSSALSRDCIVFKCAARSIDDESGESEGEYLVQLVQVG